MRSLPLFFAPRLQDFSKLPYIKDLKLNHQDWVRFLISCGLLATVTVMWGLGILERFELVTYDYRTILKGSRSADPHIVVVEISDDSVAKIGRWPWDRNWHATLIRALTDFGARAIVFDVIFSEKSDEVKDAVLAQAIRQSDRTYLAEVIQHRAGTSGEGVLRSMPLFSDGARGGGHINLMPDIDGVMRRIPLAVDVHGKITPQLSLSVFLDEYGVKLSDLTLSKDRLKIRMPEGGSLNVPLDHEGNFLINWTGRWHETFRHLSYIDVVASYAQVKKGEKPLLSPDLFKNKYVYVGTSAAGLYDIRPTPLEPSYPAVGVNLTVLNNLLERRFVKTCSRKQDFAILVLLMLAMLPIMRAKSYFRSVFLTMVLLGGFGVSAVFLFSFFDVWIKMIYPALLVVSIYFFVMLYNQLSVTIERGKLLKLATRDSLTNLYNIGHFKLLLKAEITTIAIRREKKLSVIMGDVDNFKKTNDTYGHLTGDLVLKEVAASVRSSCRALDVAARYGGEEFIVMLPGANGEEAFKVADKIRQSVATKVFFHEKGDFNTTISMGVTQVSPDDKDVDAVVARADRALYTAKKSGKNKVIMATDSPIIQETLGPA